MAALESAEGVGALKGLAELVVVGKIVGMHADVVGLRVLNEAYGFNIAETVDEGLADPVHAVHHRRRWKG